MTYDLSQKSYLVAPNGTRLDIWGDDKHRYTRLRQLFRALGYSTINMQGSMLAMVFKYNSRFNLFTKNIRGGAAYVVQLDQVIPILKTFIGLTLSTSGQTPGHKLIQDNARMEASRLIEILNREVFGKVDNSNDTPKGFCLVPATPEKQSKSLLETKENIKMENNNTQNPVHVVSVEDIEDIGNRVKATITVFRVAEKDALRAVTKLKAEEINRDLSPLIELLG